MKLNQMNGADFVTGKAGLTAAGADVLYDTAAAFDYCINGVAKTRAAISSGTAPATDYAGAAFTALGADKICAFLWMVNAAGTVGIAQGPIEAIDPDTDDIMLARPEFPPIPAGWVPFAYQLLQVDGTGSAWTFGTSLWNATGVTDAIVDVLVMPSKPQADARS